MTNIFNIPKMLILYKPLHYWHFQKYSLVKTQIYNYPFITGISKKHKSQSASELPLTDLNNQNMLKNVGEILDVIYFHDNDSEPYS